MWVDVQVGARFGVWKSLRARGVSGSLDTWVCGSPILREYSAAQGRGTTAPLFRAKLDLLGSPDTVETVVLDYAVPGSAGGRSHPLVWSAAVAVWVVTLRQGGMVNAALGFHGDPWRCWSWWLVLGRCDICWTDTQNTCE